MKRKIIGMLVMVAVMGMLGAMPVMAEPYTYDKEADGTILIDSVEDLMAFATEINDGILDQATNARLMDDIALNATDNWEQWGPDTAGLTAWTPIGNQTNPYTGNFDGGNHTISGIYINAPDATEGQGLFGECSSDIKDLKVTASYINAPSATVGGIAGFLEGSITNCQVEANLVGKSGVGGIVGGGGTTIITGSSFSGSVTGDDSIGGIAGFENGSSSIINCYNTANVNGNHYVGGIIGYMVIGRVENCANTGAIVGNSLVGGIAGINFTGSIVNCYQAGVVTGGDALTGGILGKDANDANCSNCYYLSGSAVNAGTPAFGIGEMSTDIAGQTEVKPAEAFASGEVAYRLNHYSAFDQPNWHHWTQNPGDATPSLAPDGSNIIDKKITFDFADPAADLVFYGAVGSTLVGLPGPPAAATYAYTKTSPADGTVYSQAEMASYQLTAVDDLVFTVKAYQLAVNNEGVIEIDTPAELTEFAKYVNDGNTGANGRLTADIVLNEVFDPETNWKTWGPTTGLTSWIPIGNSSKPYTGNFDGANHTISGIYINAPNATEGQGLFGECSSDIKDLKVAASYLNAQYAVGGIASLIKDGSITNCQVEANLVAGSYVGGIVGGAGTTTITGSSFSGGMTGGASVGGIAGFAEKSSSIINCYNTAIVTGNLSVGGIVGYSYESRVENSANTGTIVGNSRVGGIIGFSISDSIANCYQTGAVTGADTLTGGIVGENSGTGNSSNCYYLTDSAVNAGTPAYGIGGATADIEGQTAAKPDTAFVSGEVTWRLQNGQVNPANQVWGQQLGDGGEALPLLKTTDRVYQLTLMKGNGTDVYNQEYRNVSKTIALPLTAAYTWQDAGGTVYQEVNDAADHTLIPRITALPTAEAVYGTKLGAIAFSGGSAPLSGWRWSGTATELAQIPVVGNTVGYPATYTAADDFFGTQTVTITPTIKSGGGGGGGGYTPPGMSGITVTPRVISFDPSGQITVDISGLPAGATVYYSLNVSSYSTTPPPITRAGAFPLYLRITCPGYQDFTTQTTVTVAKQVAPAIPTIIAAISGGQPAGSTDLGALLPADRGLTRFQLGTVADPTGLLDGDPTIDDNGLIAYGFRPALSDSEQAVSAADQPADQLVQGAAAAKTATITVLVSMENYQDTTLTLVVGKSEPIGIRYLTHIQDIGWERDWVTAGALSGTAGQSKRLEALKVELTGEIPAEASIDTAVHVQNLGDLGPFAMGSAAGTSGQSRRLENISLTLNNLPGYTLRYNVHVQNQGWLRDEADPSSWFSSGEVAGTSGKSLRLEAIRIALVKDE